MAWVRTSVALIGFGFTIVQFFERLNSMEGVAAAGRPFAARYVGLVLIAPACSRSWSRLAVSLVVRYLWHGDFAKIAGIGKPPGHTPVYLISIIMIVVGVVGVRGRLRARGLEVLRASETLETGRVEHDGCTGASARPRTCAGCRQRRS